MLDSRRDCACADVLHLHAAIEGRAQVRWQPLLAHLHRPQHQWRTMCIKSVWTRADALGWRDSGLRVCCAQSYIQRHAAPPSKRKKQVNRLPHVSAARQGSLRVEQSIVCSPCKKAKLCPSANRTHEFSCRATHTRREDPAAVQLRHQCERPCAPDLACLGVGRRFGLSTVVV